VEPVCWACRHGDHDACVANGTKFCVCPVCWIDDDKDEDMEEIPADEGG
jgi:hypothetical protein